MDIDFYDCVTNSSNKKNNMKYNPLMKKENRLHVFNNLI